MVRNTIIASLLAPKKTAGMAARKRYVENYAASLWTDPSLLKHHFKRASNIQLN